MFPSRNAIPPGFESHPVRLEENRSRKKRQTSLQPSVYPPSCRVRRPCCVAEPTAAAARSAPQIRPPPPRLRPSPELHVPEGRAALPGQFRRRGGPVTPTSECRHSPRLGCSTANPLFPQEDRGRTTADRAPSSGSAGPPLRRGQQPRVTGGGAAVLQQARSAAWSLAGGTKWWAPLQRVLVAPPRWPPRAPDLALPAVAGGVDPLPPWPARVHGIHGRRGPPLSPPPRRRRARPPPSSGARPPPRADLATSAAAVFGGGGRGTHPCCGTLGRLWSPAKQEKEGEACATWRLRRGRRK
ncbi:hypothetical protein PVAP13_5KG588907 [Panicum virgatum]|uniref:Uncharacterized protein n=1 Tax=Panicum virgatum TaxID=38727 RepID=A0A8T0SRN3_PANVG|nr:hypothetical protein PVAP13_5KG588907 [Panicum virgatum]